MAHDGHGGAGRRFWEKFGSDAPTLAGKHVLEIGCGGGRRSIEAAERGAQAVLGIDISDTAVEGARATLQATPLAVKERVRFERCKIEDLADEGFDVVLSEDTFEHILDPAEALRVIRTKLRKGGYAFIGFAPLYHSPYGDHGWIRDALPFGKLPWSHLLLPERVTFRLLSRRYGKPVRNTLDWQFLALNQWTADDFLRMYRDSGMEIVSLETEKHDRRLVGRVFDALGRAPFLRKYFTAGLYCVLRK